MSLNSLPTCVAERLDQLCFWCVERSSVIFLVKSSNFSHVFLVISVTRHTEDLMPFEFKINPRGGGRNSMNSHIKTLHHPNPFPSTTKWYQLYLMHICVNRVFVVFFVDVLQRPVPQPPSQFFNTFPSRTTKPISKQSPLPPKSIPDAYPERFVGLNHS